MRESIHKYFQVGTIQWMSYPKSDPMDSLKAIARDDYFDAIELKGYGEKNAEAKALLEQIIRPDSTILVKASRGMQMEELTAFLMEHTTPAKN